MLVSKQALFVDFITKQPASTTAVMRSSNFQIKQQWKIKVLFSDLTKYLHNNHHYRNQIEGTLQKNGSYQRKELNSNE